MTSSATFISETTTSIAGTNGNGAVTLTQRTSIPRMSTAFGTGTRTVRYVIRDDANFKYEEGFGTVASNVLTRTSPQITWDGTTWTANTGAAPIAFGSSPTSGNVLIEIAAVAEGQFATMVKRQSSVAGDGTWRDYPWTPLFEQSGNGGTITLTANREYYQLYPLQVGGLLNGIQIEVTSAVASSSMSCALYNIGTDGLVGAKIVDFTGFTTTATGVKTDTATGSWSTGAGVWLNPGWYVTGHIASHAIGLRGTGGSNNTTAITPFGRYDAYGMAVHGYAAGSGTTMPANPTLSTLIGNGTQHGFWYGLRVQA